MTAAAAEHAPAPGAAPGSRGAREFTGSMRLPAGSYTAFFASFPDGEYWSDDNAKNPADRKWHWFGDDPVEQFKLLIRGNGRILSAAETSRLAEANASAIIVALRGKFHEAFEESGFALAKATEIHIAAEGEAREDGEFDFGWIINADTRAKVWRFTWRDSPLANVPRSNGVRSVSAITTRIVSTGTCSSSATACDSDVRMF